MEKTNIMSKWIVFILIAIAMTLTACQASNPSGARDTTVPGAVATVATQLATQTRPALAGQPSPQVSPTQAVAAVPGAPAGCTVVSPQPTPGPTEQSAFPPVSDEDWVKGPETAFLTIIEYGDFM